MMPPDGLPNRPPPLPAPLDRIARAYGQAIARQGPRAAGVGWSSEAAQMLRLRALLRVLDGEPAARVTAHDLGCGYGALWPLLAALEAPRIIGYVGYDICAPMVGRARSLYGHDARARFLLADAAVEDADYGFVSGTFNYRDRTDPDTWQGYVQDSLADFAGACRKGLAFNLLHQRASRRARGMFYADPATIIAFAHDRLAAPRGGTVAVIDDYLGDDFTVVVRFPR